MRFAFLALLVCSLWVKLQAKETPKTINQSIGYIENKGQIIDQNNHLNPSVKYLYNGNGLNVQLRANGFSYDTYTIERKPRVKSESEQKIPEKFKEPEEDITYHFHRIDIAFIGASANPSIIADQANTGYTNYYTIGTDEAGVTFVKTYQHVTYKNLYAGIDLEFILDENNKPKYNFIIHPGADVNQIKWQYIGANKTSLENNKIILGIAQGNLEEKIPLSYIAENGAKHQVNYQQKKENTFGFHIGQYDQTKTLIIDPVPWATYFGGNMEDYGYGISTDTNGNVFSCGVSNSTTNIATIGSHQTALAGAYDGFITKFNNSGLRLWATYYGGADWDFFYMMDIDRFGSGIYVCGSTVSTSNVVTIGAHQVVLGSIGNSDALLARFNNLGIRQWATYYGGAGNDRFTFLTVSLNGDIYAIGETESVTSMSTTGSHQASMGGTSDGFLVKFNALGTRLWGTYYGGNDEDELNSIKSDGSGNIYICGSTQSNNNISTIGSHQFTFGGLRDGFVAKFNSSGTRLWGTYYGGVGYDYLNSISVDVNGDVFVCGTTQSTSNIATSGAHQITYLGNTDAILVKFNGLGVRQWGTYYGGTSPEHMSGVTTDTNGNIYICGQSQSAVNMATIGSYKAIYGGGGDALLVKFNTLGVRQWATYLGGSAFESFSQIIVDSNANIYLCGYTASNSNISTSGVHQTIYGGGIYDAFIAAFTSNGGLPVKLLSFAGKKDGEGIVLAWQTASEVNNAQFEIERSNNNTDWINIGSVKGNGTTNLTSRYQFIDNSPSIAKQEPSLYYRLKQIDFDGAYEYSKTILIEDKDLNEGIISPNPFTNNLSIEVNSLNTGLGKLKIIDAMGKEYYNSMEPITEGLNQIDINTSSFAKGLYIVQLQINGQLVSRKVLKQ
jgi:hypothetical protein